MELLGAGSFGAVYRARQLLFGHNLREVALKLFETEIVTPQNMHDVFNDAIAVIGLKEENPKPEVSHHIIQIYDIGVLKAPAPPRAFVSMELIRGGKTLESQVRRFRPDGMPVATSLKYLRQILVPLAWMHTLETPVVHGDLKPDNVLLTEAFDLIVTDFGLAARLPLGSMGGAIQYQAPETLLGVCAEAPADVYGVGLIWYEMLTGRHPFENVGLEALGADDSRGFIAAHQRARQWPIRSATPQDNSSNPQRIHPASEINDELRAHPQLEAILNGCLAYKQTERFANARVLLGKLDEYLANGSVEGLATAPTTQKVEPAKTALPTQTPENLVADSKVLLQQGRCVEAIAKAAAALRVDEKFVPACLAIVRAASSAGQFDKAKESYQKAKELAPRNPEVYEAGAELYKALGKPGMAESLGEEAVALRQKAGGGI